MRDDLFDLANDVTDEETFLAFGLALAADRAEEERQERVGPSSPNGPGANGWENNTISSFLESAVAWADISRNGLAMYEPSPNAWCRCAQILLMGKHYE